MLRIRIDSETLNKLDECVKVQNNNRSEVVRNGINEQYDKIKKQTIARLPNKTIVYSLTTQK